MRGRGVFVLVLAAIAVVAMRPGGSDADGVVKVMSFNIQHGIDAGGKYNLQRAIDTIAKTQPDVVGLQEVTRNHPYYNCDDQPAKIAAGLKAATGRTWSVAYEQEWFTPNVECRDSGRGDGKETEGLAFLSPAPLGATAMATLPASRIAFTAKPQALGGTPITVTHLASGKNNGPQRGKQVDALLKWIDKFGAAQLVLGDFNLTPQEPELQPMLTMFRDAWTDAKGAGGTTGPEGTHGEKRIDFIFMKGDALQLMSVESVETAGWFGKAASDHRPVVARFRLAHGVK
jgi:endonuclease/exonuclease/phosphatase family metal-dependent hydrolase